MTDRGRSALGLSPDALRVGPSRMAWQDGRLVIDVDEIASPPLPGRIRGRITVTPAAVTEVELPLTPDGAHVWRPFAPAARVEVDLGRRGRWSGHGYLDANFGTRALEADFSTWTWGRFPLPGGTACFYEARRRDGTELSFATLIDADGRPRAIAAPPPARLPRTFWGLRRTVRADPGTRPRQTLAMLDAPFYSRSAVTTTIGGARSLGVHEALDLDRFRSPALKPMLAVRVPRRRGWTDPPGGAALGGS